MDSRMQDDDKYHKSDSHVRSRRVAFGICAVSGITIGLIIFAVVMGREAPKVQPLKDVVYQAALPPQEWRRHTDCSDVAGAAEAARDLATLRKEYMHVFEYIRLHSCCVYHQPSTSDSHSESKDEARVSSLSTKLQSRAPLKDGRASHGYSGAKNDSARQHNGFADQSTAPNVSTADIVFVVFTSHTTVWRAHGILESWGKGLENLVFISDESDPELGVISFPELSKHRMELNEEPNLISTLKYILERRRLQRKWLMLVDDECWINVPRLLSMISMFNPDCPVAVGYVWSHVWREDVDYLSSKAGRLLSRGAFANLAPSFCDKRLINEMTFSKCLWESGVQLVHHRDFYFDPPERSRDRNEMIWLPPLAEALTFQHVKSSDMALMTAYVNHRWQWKPPLANATASAATDARPRPGDAPDAEARNDTEGRPKTSAQASQLKPAQPSGALGGIEGLQLLVRPRPPIQLQGQEPIVQ